MPASDGGRSERRRAGLGGRGLGVDDSATADGAYHHPRVRVPLHPPQPLARAGRCGPRDRGRDRLRGRPAGSGRLLRPCVFGSRAGLGDRSRSRRRPVRRRAAPGRGARLGGRDLGRTVGGPLRARRVRRDRPRQRLTRPHTPHDTAATVRPVAVACPSP
ncbi:MAG: hypothetical protein F4X60_05735, partial [Gemmatimonadetes bacterium]|nr:hypothetical protein [Gemmatimonadota bacterium]